VGTIKEKDFVEVEYTARVLSDNSIFDTTDEKIAKKNNIHNPHMKYGALGICIGEGALVKGLENALVGKEIGKEHTIELSAKDAFGKKSTDLLKIIPSSVFAREKIRPIPGLQVSVDGETGVVKTVAAGRIIVDFNPLLAGKDVVYKIKVNKLIVDDAEKIKYYIMLQLNVRPEFFTVSVDGENAKIEFKQGISLKELNMAVLTEKFKSFSKVKKVEYIETKAAPKKAAK
jgi:FKBP-type peptidyl-prolyl cis-trans isomerase SlyD